MLSTSIRHGDLVIDFDSAGWVQITRQSTAQTIQMSVSEWGFLLKCVDIRGWPCAPPPPGSQDWHQGYDSSPPGTP